MIKLSDLTAVGRFVKPHGINGEIVAMPSGDIDFAELSCVVLEIDGIMVPFFISSVRSKSAETDLVSIDGVTDEKQAASLCSHIVYALTSDIPERDYKNGDGFYADDLVGFDIIVEGKQIGEIVDFDDSTANYLFIVDKKDDGGRMLLPVAFVEYVDAESCTVVMDVPPELLDL